MKNRKAIIVGLSSTKLKDYEKKFLLKNPFNENLTSKEDRYWAQEVIKKNKSILYDPNLEVDHHYTPNGNTWKGLG